MGKALVTQGLWDALGEGYPELEWIWLMMWDYNLYLLPTPLSFWNLALRAKIEHGAESWAHPITGVTCDCRLFLGVGSCQTCSVSVAGLQTAVVQGCSKNGKIA